MNPLLIQFLSEARDFSQEIGDKLMQLEETPDDQNIINEGEQRAVHISGNDTRSSCW
jgi:two-component system chemotaxis sensor kinase CheA